MSEKREPSSLIEDSFRDFIWIHGSFVVMAIGCAALMCADLAASAWAALPSLPALTPVWEGAATGAALGVAIGLPVAVVRTIWEYCQERRHTLRVLADGREYTEEEIADAIRKLLGGQRKRYPPFLSLWRLTANGLIESRGEWGPNRRYHITDKGWNAHAQCTLHGTQP